MAWTLQQDRMRYTAADLPEAALPPDREVKSTVVHRLRENPYTADGHIRVDVNDGVVELGGTVSSLEARQVATEDAFTIPGVVEVHNEIEVLRAA